MDMEWFKMKQTQQIKHEKLLLVASFAWPVLFFYASQNLIESAHTFSYSEINRKLKNKNEFI